MATGRQRQRRRAHQEDDGAWGHRLAAAWREQDTQVEALVGDRDALLRELLTQASGAEFIAAAWRLVNPGRTRFLTDLKVPAARRPSVTSEEAAGSAALHRMGRWPASRLVSGLEFLMSPVLADALSDVSHAGPDPESVYETGDRLAKELLDAQPPVLVTAGLVARLDAPAAAVVLAALARQGDLPGWDEAGRAALADGLRALLDALPWNQGASDDVQMDEPDDLPAFPDLVLRFRSLLDEVRGVLLAALAEVDKGSAPDPDSIGAALGRARRAHSRLLSAVTVAAHAAGLAEPEPGTSLADLVSVFDEAQRVVDPFRGVTARLGQLRLPSDLEGCTGPLRDLLGAADSDVQGAREAVLGLLAIADARAAGAGTTELHRLSTQVMAELPEALLPVPLAIMLGTAALKEGEGGDVKRAMDESLSQVAPKPPEAEPADNASPESDASRETAASVSSELPNLVEEVAGARTTDSRRRGRPGARLQGGVSARRIGETAVNGLVDAEDAGRAAVADATATVVSDAPEITRDSESLGLVYRALAKRDSGLAYWASLAGGHVALVGALRAYVLAEAITADHGPLADAAVAALEQIDADAIGQDRLAQAVTVAAALRTSIVTGSPDAGSVLELTGSYVSDEPNLASLASAVATAAQRGALAGGQIGALRSASRVNDEVARICRRAQDELDRPRGVLFARASDMAAQLFSPSGAVGTLLTAVARDDRRRLYEVKAAARPLSEEGDLRRLIDTMDRELRGAGTSTKPLQGKARTRVIEWVQAAMECVRDWLRVVGPLAQAADESSPGELRELKKTADACLAAARSELVLLAAAGPLDAAAAAALDSALATTQILLQGESLPNGAAPAGPTQVLGRALLRATTVALSATFEPVDPDQVTVAALAGALDIGWADVVAARVAAGDFVSARAAIGVAGVGDQQASADLSRVLNAALAERREALGRRQQALMDDIRKATRLGQLTDDDSTTLTAAVERADPSQREDLDVLATELNKTLNSLPGLAAAARAAVAAHLERLVAGLGASIEEERQVLELIDAGDLASADEVLAALEAHLPLPAPVSPTLLKEFYPSVPEALAEGINEDVIAAVAARGVANGLDYSALSAETAQGNSAALRAWKDAASAQRHTVTLAALLPALQMAGFAATREVEVAPELRNARSLERRFVDLDGATVVGSAVAGGFGSESGGRLRLLLVWGPATPQSIIDWVKQDSSDRPVMVCLFGTLSPVQRQKLAARAASVVGKAFVVVDDAVMAFLASRPEASATTTMRLVLPFSAVNLYVPQAEGNVPSEMFYGRTHELADLLGRPGTSLVYGGRQLGKSALLHAAERRHVDTHAGVAVYVSTPEPAAIWDALRSALEKVGIRASKSDSRRDAHAAVVATVHRWLGDNPGKRLLVLFDECDRFFDADARDSFRQTTGLRDLRNETGQMFKPVFAGVHQVARFAALPNKPLDHLGTPAPIGPLAPAEAFRLVTEPLAALGITFEDDWAAWRVLAYCNYQPILLQLVCQHLVRYVQERRDEFTPMPYMLTVDEFEHVWSSPQVLSEVSGKLRLTLELDPRYGVVGAVLGLAVHTDGKGTSMSTATLRRECEGWWPAGFSIISEDEFRALLIEMVTLGVLTQEGANWTLRSDNVLRMLGNRQEIETRLVRADEASVPGPKVAAEVRRSLDGGRVGPLTDGQMSDVIGRRNQLRIVLGSRALGADLLGTLLAEVREELGTFTLLTPSSMSKFLEGLTGGLRGGQHRVVLSDVTAVNPERVLEELELAGQQLPPDGVTRSAILVVGSDALELWLDVLDPARAHLAADSVVACRRLDSVGLERWSLDQRGQFSDLADRDKLQALSGGWPLLLDQVSADVRAGGTTREALRLLRSRLEDDLGHELLNATGIPGSVLEPAYATFVALGTELVTDVFEEDLVAELRAREPRPGPVVAALVAAGVLTRTDAGAFSLEPVLAEQWRMRM